MTVTDPLLGHVGGTVRCALPAVRECEPELCMSWGIVPLDDQQRSLLTQINAGAAGDYDTGDPERNARAARAEQ
jgi:hypothetical protein